ncbi:hypothetical protein AB0N09_30790 [Streptomyces erythrochromogenes]|uniref:hypothetical protein n=1 Tax=Streptomyces erythrochromogenes TaxID=285574 RepID=UPI0034231DFB
MRANQLVNAAELREFTEMAVRGLPTIASARDVGWAMLREAVSMPLPALPEEDPQYDLVNHLVLVILHLRAGLAQQLASCGLPETERVQGPGPGATPVVAVEQLISSAVALDGEVTIEITHHTPGAAALLLSDAADAVVQHSGLTRAELIVEDRGTETAQLRLRPPTDGPSGYAE